MNVVESDGIVVGNVERRFDKRKVCVSQIVVKKWINKLFLGSGLTRLGNFHSGYIERIPL